MEKEKKNDSFFHKCTMGALGHHTYGILICNLCLLVDFKFSFALYIFKFSLLKLVSLVKNLLIYLFSVLYNESLALNTINCACF